MLQVFKKIYLHIAIFGSLTLEADRNKVYADYMVSFHWMCGFRIPAVVQTDSGILLAFAEVIVQLPFYTT